MFELNAADVPFLMPTYEREKAKQKQDEVVYVRVKDRALLQDLTRKREEINAYFRDRAQAHVTSTILTQAPHLSWTP